MGMNEANLYGRRMENPALADYADALARIRTDLARIAPIASPRANVTRTSLLHLEDRYAGAINRLRIAAEIKQAAKEGRRGA